MIFTIKHNRQAAILKSLTVVSCISMLCACGMFSAVNPWNRYNALEYVVLEASANANAGDAFDVHLVFVMDKNLAQEYANLSSHQWFYRTDERLITPNTRVAIEKFHFEAQVPAVRNFEMPRAYYEAWSVLAFASYTSPPFAALRLEGFERVKIYFSQSNMIASALPEE